MQERIPKDDVGTGRNRWKAGVDAGILYSWPDTWAQEHIKSFYVVLVGDSRCT